MSWQLATASISVLLGYPVVGALLGYGLSAVLAEELADLASTSVGATATLRSNATTSLWAAWREGRPLLPAVRRGVTLGGSVGILALLVNWVFQLWPWNPWLPPGQHVWMCC